MDKIKYPSKIDNWKMFEENYNTIAFNVLYIKEMEICTAHISKINSNCAKKKKKIFIMIQNKEKGIWHYLAVKDCLHY